MSMDQIKDELLSIRLATLQDQLRNSRSFDRVIADRSVSGVMDAQSQRIVRATPGLERLFGYLPGELLGQPIHVLVPDDKRAMHSKYVESFCHKPEPRQMGTVNMRLEGQTKQGSVFPTEILLDPVMEFGTLLVIFNVMGIIKR